MIPQIHIEQDEVHVAPGAVSMATVKIVNTSPIIEEFRLDILGDDLAWTSISPDTVSLFPEDEISVQVLFAPKRSATIIPGPRAFGVRASSQVNTSDIGYDDAVVVVEPFTEMNARLSPQSATTKRSTEFHAIIANTGNIPVNVEYMFSDDEDSLECGFTPRSIALYPGQTQSVRTGIAVRKRFFGAPAPHQFQIDVTGAPMSADYADEIPEATSTTMIGVVTSIPMIPNWVKRLMIIIPILAVLAFLLWGYIASPSEVVPIGDGAPNPPYAVDAAPASPQSIRIQWTDAGGATDGYQVFQAPAPDSPASPPNGGAPSDEELIPRVSPDDVISGCAGCEEFGQAPQYATVFLAEGLDPETLYCFRMVALRGTFVSRASPTTCAITTAVLLPCVPTNIVAVAAPTGTDIDIGWTPGSGTDCAPAPLTGFEIALDLAVGTQILDEAKDSDTAKQIADLQPGTKYCFRLRALNDTLMSPFSPPACIDTPAAPPSPGADTGAVPTPQTEPASTG